MQRKENYPYLKFSTKTRRKISLFFTCFSFAIAVWLFYTLSKEYTFVVSTNLTYKNLPPDAAFHIRDPGTIQVTIVGTGWQLFFSRFRFAPSPLQLDLAKLEGNKFILLNQHLADFNNQISVNQKITSILPDTLHIDYATRLEKKVPIELIATFDFAPRHYISSAIQIIPDSVLISGPVDIIRGISSWPTPALQYSKLRDNLRTVVVLSNTNIQSVNLKPNIAQLVISVEEFTEKSLQLPISIQNNVENFDVQLIPKSVEITFLVPLSKFSVVNESDFEVSIDLEDWKKRKLKKLLPTVNRQPDFIRLIKVNPMEIDFLIQK